MTKQELTSQLENAKNNYILGLAAISIFSNKDAQKILESSNVKFGGYTVDFKQVSILLANEDDKIIATKEFINSQIRALIKESFELIKNYCEESNQSALFKAKEWHQFSRMIRNCLSHNFKFMFNNTDKGILPVDWNGKEITIAMDGENLKLEFFGYVETWELFSSFQSFVTNELN